MAKLMDVALCTYYRICEISLYPNKRLLTTTQINEDSGSQKGLGLGLNGRHLELNNS